MTTETEQELTGKVLRVSSTGSGLQLDTEPGVWLNVSQFAPVELPAAGATVSLTVRTSNNRRYIQRLTVHDRPAPAAATSAPAADRDTRIVREVALKAAVDLYAGAAAQLTEYGPDPAQAVLLIADQFVAWIREGGA